MKAKPVFIHSLFRSGSTYVLDVFRRSEKGYWCYYEPFHEQIWEACADPEILLQSKHEKAAFLRHPEPKNPYFWEFYLLREEFPGTFRKQFSYDTFFGAQGESAEGIGKYLDLLVRRAQGRPVFECCRTFARVPLLKEKVAGVHIFLWRNPWDQWWSYKTADYFETTNQLILNAHDVPDIFRSLRRELGFSEYHSDDILDEFRYHARAGLTSEQSYLLFYTIWAFGLLENIQKSDLLINIDTLSSSEKYRIEVLSELAQRDIDGLDFSDCKIPQIWYAAKERAFFEAIEARAHQMLMQNGYTQSEVLNLLELRGKHSPEPHWKKRSADVIRRELTDQAARARDLAQKYETDVAQLKTQLGNTEGHAGSLQRERERLNENLDQSRKHGQWLEGELERSRVDLDESIQYAKRLEADLGESRTESERIRQHARHLEGQLARATESAERLKEELREADRHQQWLQNEFSHSRSEVGRLQTECGALREHATSVENELAQSRDHGQRLGGELGQSRAQIHNLSLELAAVYRSRSWRITWPVRASHDLLKSGKRGLQAVGRWVTGRTKRLIKSLLLTAVRWTQGHPRILGIGKKLLARFPYVDGRMRDLVRQQDRPVSMEYCESPLVAVSTPNQHGEGPCIDWGEHPSSVRKIYHDLKQAVEKRRS